MIFCDIPADPGYSGYDPFASLVQWISNGDHLCDPTIEDDLNNIIRIIISIQKPLCVSPCSLILDSTPGVSEEQENKEYSIFRSSSPYVFNFEPRDTLAIRDPNLNGPLNQVASPKGCSSSTVPGVPTSENHGDVF